MSLEFTKKELSKQERYNSNYVDTFQCVFCGKEIEIKYVEPTERVFCECCKKEHLKQHKELVKQYTDLKLRVMHENALREMERSCKCYINDMLNAINFVREMEIASPSSFCSIYEIITAIILIDSGIDFKINHKLLNYKIDFFIPDKFVCLEIDGEHHNFRLAKDGKRDVEIRNFLGEKWETIRMPTKLISENPCLIIDGIDELYKEIKKVRSRNNGIIPSSFSRSAKAYYKEFGLE